MELGGNHPRGRARPFGSDEVTAIVPTRNERDNIAELIRQIEALDDDRITTVIVVDDSDDDTPQVVERVAASSDLDVVLDHRVPGRRTGGLGGAVVQGLRAVHTPWACVLDADLQHPPELIPRMLSQASVSAAGLVVGTRYSKNGSAESFSAWRMGVSLIFTGASRLAFPRSVGRISDPMSGFFIVRPDQLDLSALRPDGYKILMEILVRNPAITTAEVGFEFGERFAGESKAGMREGMRFVRQLVKSSFTAPRRGSGRHFHYDIHGIITVGSPVALPELAKFRVDRVLNPDIRVSLGSARRNGHGDAIAYREVFGRLGFAIRIERGETTDITVSQLVARSPHVLYTNVVEPVLRWSLVPRGYALVHAACIERQGRAHMVTARTDTGKTTTMLKILANGGGFGFISDDLTLITRTGDVMTYPKPLTISQHTLHATPRNHLSRRQRMGLAVQSRLHSRAGRKAGFVLAGARLPAATLSAVVQKLIPPPKYHVEQLIPQARLADRARLAGLFIIERGGTGSEIMNHEEAMSTLLENCEDAYGFPPYDSIAPFLRRLKGSDLAALEREIITEAFSNVPASVHRSETLDWAERLPEYIEAVYADDTDTVIDLSALESDEEQIQSTRQIS